ncbi:hypothetical protein ZIOFF_043601 [Zingiber officinale]|uniref:Uncharacterized protein n=1 Tax=Zingiber officinale TaxID=94328 RepID=A0A8J5KU29_ZINOF|nr:hypothetical protein ZIOFF_043601 [Zingiber officinale]
MLYTLCYGHSLLPLCNVTFYRNFNPDQKFGPVFVFSIKLALLMEIIDLTEAFITHMLYTLCYGHSLFPLCNVTFYRNFNPDQKFGPVFVFSIKLALLMEIIDFSVRFLSSFLWVRMYRLGVSTLDNTTYCADYNVRDSFVNPPTNEVARQTSNANKILGGSVYDPSYYSSLFEDIQETQHMTECHQPVSSSTLPLSLLSALLPTLDWVTPAAYISPETAVGHIPIDPKPEQISDPSFEVKFYAVVGQSLHTVAIGSCNDGEFETLRVVLEFWKSFSHVQILELCEIFIL